MSATKKLRRLLDERGVKWRMTPHYSSESDDNETVFDGNGLEWYAREFSNDYVELRTARLIVTPEQAVEATVGPLITEDTSDGWHSFKDLYHHRALLFSVIVHNYRNMCWKSKKHHDGTMYDGMFIVGIDTPWGQASYHYGMEYWDLFDCNEVEQAPYYDGYTADESVARIARLAELDTTVGAGTCRLEKGATAWLAEYNGYITGWVCDECGGLTFYDAEMRPRFCVDCGRKVVE